MTRHTIIIPGKPFAKQRPRFSRKTGRAYTPAATVSFETTVASIAAQTIKTPISGAVMVTIVATFVPGKSLSKRERASRLAARHHTQKPDLDNLAKAIKDGLNRIAWADDAQVSGMRAEKLWGETDHTTITIEALA